MVNDANVSKNELCTVKSEYASLKLRELKLFADIGKYAVERLGIVAFPSYASEYEELLSEIANAELKLLALENSSEPASEEEKQKVKDTEVLFEPFAETPEVVAETPVAIPESVDEKTESEILPPVAPIATEASVVELHDTEQITADTVSSVGIKCECGYMNKPNAAFCEECGKKFEPKASEPENMVKCQACNYQNKPNAAFCAECGQKLGVPEAPVPRIEDEFVFCPKCGKKYAASSRFCGECGSKLR